MTDLPIDLDHVERQMTLPHHHRDPLDRILVAQAMVLGIPRHQQRSGPGCLRRGPTVGLTSRRKSRHSASRAGESISRELAHSGETRIPPRSDRLRAAHVPDGTRSPIRSPYACVKPSIRTCESISQRVKKRPPPIERGPSGGAGNRTRVPRHFRAGVYVRSKFLFEARLAAAPRSLRASPACGVRVSLSVRVFSERRHRGESGCPNPQASAIGNWRPNHDLSREGHGTARGLLSRERELRFSS